MSNNTPEGHAERRALTRGAAEAFFEDMPYLREIVSRTNPTRGELRRLSAVLRRLLHERDIETVAAPRIGRVTLLAPQNQPFYKSEAKAPFVFFASGGAAVLGVFVRGAFVDAGPRSRDIYDLDDKPIELRFQNFLAQRVICVRGEWASRDDVITFMANIGSGVHSGNAKAARETLLQRARHCATYGNVKTPDGSTAMSMMFNIGGIHGVPAEPEYRPDKIDPVLVELLCAAHFVSISPAVIELEAYVKAELGV